MPSFTKNANITTTTVLLSGAPADTEQWTVLLTTTDSLADIAAGLAADINALGGDFSATATGAHESHS